MPRNAEDCIQASIVSYVRSVAPDCVIAAIPNGGLRTKAEAARFAWTGVVAGIPDLLLMMPGGKVGFIEVKTDTGRLSPAQVVIRDRMIVLGTPHVLARCIDDVRAALTAWGAPTREAL